MASDLVELLKREQAAPKEIKGLALDGIELTATTKKPSPLLVSDYLASLNRRERRNFARQNGIFVNGSSVPVININKKK